MNKTLLLVCLFFTLFSYSQDQQLAYEYLRKGEYEKAISIYQALYDQNNFNSNYLSRLIYCHRQTESFGKSQVLIENHLKKYPNQIQFYVELGYNFELQHFQEKAETNYQKALSGLEANQNYGYVVGRTFHINHLLDYALLAYKKTISLNPKASFDIQIASIYGEKGDLENMFNTYLDMVEKDDKHLSTILRYVNVYTAEDSNNSYNVLFKKLVLKRLQQSSKNVWNQLLSWLFTTQKEYGKAFIQEKALHKRNIDSLGLEGILNLGEIAFEFKDYTTTKNSFNYILEHTNDQEVVIESKLYLLMVATETIDDLEAVDAQFQEVFKEYGITANTVEFQIYYADFLAFKKDDPEKGIEVLDKALNLATNTFIKAEIKLKLGDLYVFKSKFNTALVYFSQVQTSLKNHILAQEARFKVAQTSYYKGDFKWAQTQLKVLKSSTSQLIANDALDLSLTISDNTVKDSLKTALKLYAKAELFAYQNKYPEAIQMLDTLLLNHKGHAIEDEALFKQAEAYEKIEAYEKAEQNYLKLIAINSKDILVDDAYYRLAEISLKQNHLEKAKEYYQKIIFDFSSSIYLVDARKKYRTLRGDSLQ